MSVLDVAYEMLCRERQNYGPNPPGLAAPFGVPPDMPAHRWVVSRAMMQALTEAAQPAGWDHPVKSAFGAERRLFGWAIYIDSDAPPETLRLEQGR